MHLVFVCHDVSAFVFHREFEGVYLILVEEDHVGAHGVHQLNPLGESHCEIFRDVEAFHTDVKML